MRTAIAMIEESLREKRVNRDVADEADLDQQD
jgi:hypothetical protein